MFVVAMIALFSARPSSAQIPGRAFRAALAELREASFADKEAASGAWSRRPIPAHARCSSRFSKIVSTSARRTAQIFIVKSADAGAGAAFELVDPVSSSDAGTAPREELTRIGTNNRLRRVLKTDGRAFRPREP